MARSKGLSTPFLDSIPPFPIIFIDLYRQYMVLSMTKDSYSESLKFTEIKSYCDLYKIYFSQAELDVLLRLDNVYSSSLAEFYKKDEK